jgi:predicted metal-dependent hydrolase
MLPAMGAKNHEFRLTLPDGSDWPYAIRRHARSKSLRMRLNPVGQLLVTAPPWVPQRAVHQFVAARSAWVHEHLQRVLLQAASRQVLPDSITLQAVDEDWSVTYASAPGERLQLRAALEPGGSRTLQLQGDTADEAACRQLLRRWLAAEGRSRLLPWLASLSEETGLSYRAASIRGQKTRWGSYSARGDVSLNWKLLFLPPRLVRYVLIHELCHSLEMNHSSRFWQQVGRFETDLPEIRRQMRTAGAHLPCWLEQQG